MQDFQNRWYYQVHQNWDEMGRACNKNEPRTNSIEFLMLPLSIEDQEEVPKRSGKTVWIRTSPSLKYRTGNQLLGEKQNGKIFWRRPKLTKGCHANDDDERISNSEDLSGFNCGGIVESHLFGKSVCKISDVFRSQNSL